MNMYVGLWARRVELDKETAQVKAQIRKAEAKISSEREAIKDTIKDSRFQFVHTRVIRSRRKKSKENQKQLEKKKRCFTFI